MAESVARARARREEEEKRFEQSRLAAQEKAKLLARNRSVSQTSDKEASEPSIAPPVEVIKEILQPNRDDPKFQQRNRSVSQTSDKQETEKSASAASSEVKEILMPVRDSESRHQRNDVRRREVRQVPSNNEARSDGRERDNR